MASGAPPTAGVPEPPDPAGSTESLPDLQTLPARFGRSAASNYAMVGASLVTAIVTTPVLARNLGKEQFGVFLVVSSLVSYLSLLEFGFGKSTVRFVAELEARGEHGAARRAVATSFTILLVPATLALVGGLVLALGFPQLLGVDADLEHETSLLIVVSVIPLALAIPTDAFGGVLQAFGRYDQLNITLVAATIAQAIGWVVLAEQGGGIVALGLVTAIANLLSQAARVVLGTRLLGTWPLSPKNVDRSLLGELSRTSGWFAVYNIAKLAVERVDAVVVGVVVGAAQAATYAVGQKLASFASRIVFPISAALFPHAAELEGRGSRQGLRDTVRLGTRISLGIAGPVCVTAALLARPTLRVWLGPGFADAAPVVVYLLAAVSISALVYTASLVTQGAGDARTPSLAYLAEGAINLVLSVLLGRALGFTGVALATLIATAAVQLLWFYPFLCRKLGMPLGRTISALLVPHLLPAAAAVVVGFAVRGPADDGVVQLLIAGALTAGTYVVLLALTGLTPDERRALIDRLRRVRAGTGTADAG